MSEHIGKYILGHVIYQDMDVNWVKIDNVAVGESSQFAYKMMSSMNIGSLLKELVSDSSTAVVVYEWGTGKAFLKTGLDINDPRDSVLKTGMTSFIRKAPVAPAVPVWKASNRYSAGSRVSFNGIEYIADVDHASSDITAPGYVLWKVPGTSTPNPSAPSVPSGNFVTSNGVSFLLNGKKFAPVGFNCYMLGLTEQYTYPTDAQITEIFEAAKKMSVTVIRSHTLGISSGHRNSIRPHNNILNEAAWRPIDFAFAEAKRLGIKLICPMVDGYYWYNGNYGDFCKTLGVPKNQFFSHPGVRADWYEYISKWLNHVNQFTGIANKDAPELAFIQIGNELGNIRPDHDSTVVPSQEWITNTVKHIKSIDKNHLVLNGSDEALGSSVSNDFEITELDAYSSHFYGHDYNRISHDASRSRAAGKPYLITEFSAQFGQDWYSKIESIPHVCGGLAWSMYPHTDGTPNGNRIPHTDGFTFWFDSKDLKNTRQVLLIANHCKRMQGLPQINRVD